MAKLARLPPEKRIVPFEDAISMTGFGKFNFFVLLATGGCLMCVIIETMCMMFIIPAAQCDLGLGLSEKGILSSISFFGVVSGSHLWGFLADTRGRRLILIISLLSSATLSLICSIIPWSWLFIVLRYLNGFLIGGSSAVIYAFAGEFHDNTYRPKIVSWMATFVAIGNMYIPGLAWAILPDEWSIPVPAIDILFRPWRLLIIMYALPSFLFAVCIYFLPESPKYLLTQGKYDEVLDILKTMYSINFNKPKEHYPVSQILWDELDDKEEVKKRSLLKSMWKQTVPLFKKPFLLKTIMVSMLQFLIFFSTSGVVMWYPEILNRMSHYSTEVADNEVGLCISIQEIRGNVTNPETKVCKDTVNTEVFAVSLIVGATYAFAYIFIGSVINIFGKKKLLIGFILVTTTAGLVSQFVYGYLLIQILIGLFVLAGAGIGIVNTFVVDLYPTQIRAMALAVSLMFGRFGAMAGSNTVGPILFNVCDYLFYIIAADHIIVIIVVFLLPSSPHIPRLKETIT